MTAPSWLRPSASLDGRRSRSGRRVLVGDLIRQDPLRRWLGFEPAAIGRYWAPHAELDLVALDRDRRQAAVAEVKWTERPIGQAVARKLRARAESVEPLRSTKKRYVLFSRAGFTDNLQAEVPDDMYLVDLSRWRAPNP